MTISIALAVYNGAEFLSEQLDSYINQTRLPDELVVVDDRSTDQSNEVVARFAEAAPFPVRIHRNERNLGSMAAFERAIALCSGDLIFPSDQDDVWIPKKLERISREFEADTDLNLVFANAGLVSADLHSLDTSLFDEGKCREIDRCVRGGKLVEKILIENVVSGALCGFRVRTREFFLPFPPGLTLLHDGWFGLIAAATGKVLFLREEVNLYRQHDAQQLGARGYDPARRVEDRSKKCEITAGLLLKKESDARIALSRLRELSNHDPTDQYLAKAVTSVENCIEKFTLAASHFQRRANLPPGALRRLPAVLAEAAAGGYHRYSNGFQSVFRDVFFE